VIKFDEAESVCEDGSRGFIFRAYLFFFLNR